MIASVAASDGPTIPPRDVKHRLLMIEPTPWTLLSTLWLPAVENAPTTGMESRQVGRLRTVRWTTLPSWPVRTLVRVWPTYPMSRPMCRAVELTTCRIRYRPRNDEVTDSLAARRSPYLITTSPPQR